jgi:hypothetical protein
MCVYIDIYIYELIYEIYYYNLTKKLNIQKKRERVNEKIENAYFIYNLEY